MGRRPSLLLILTAALMAGPSLALAPAADPLPELPVAVTPPADTGAPAAGVPTVDDVLASASSALAPPSASAGLVKGAAATARPATDAVGVYVVTPSPAGPPGTPWSPGRSPVDDLGLRLRGSGPTAPMLPWDTHESITYSHGPATVPPPPVFAPTGGSIAAPGDLETQDAETRRLAEFALLGGTLTYHEVAAAVVGVALLALAPWVLYHRIRGNSTLENRTRKVIYDLICTAPGAGVQEVATGSGVTYSTASYHLDRLVDAGMLVVSAEGSRLRYFKNGGQFNEEERKILPVLESAEACRILEAILDRPYTYRAAIAERLGVSTTTVNWHLRRLLDLGLVHETREGRSAHLYVDRTRLGTVVVPLSNKLPEAPEGVRRIAARMEAPAPALAA